MSNLEPIDWGKHTLISDMWMQVTLKEKLRKNSGLALGSTLDRVTFVTSLWRKTHWKLFQAEAFKVHYTLIWKKNSLANMKDRILDFSFTSFNLSRCQIPLANSNVWSPLRTYRGPVSLPSSYLFLQDLFSLTRTRLRLL